DQASVAAVEVGKADYAIRGCDDGLAVFGGDVHATVEGALTIERVNALAEGSGDASLDRPQGRRLGHPYPIRHGEAGTRSHADADGGHPVSADVRRALRRL